MKKPLSEEALIEIVGREQVGMRRMRAGPVLLLVVCAVVAYQNMARADDLSPAIFRGETGARMDRWDFANPDTEANEENWAPEESDSEPPRQHDPARVASAADTCLYQRKNEQNVLVAPPEPSGNRGMVKVLN